MHAGTVGRVLALLGFLHLPACIVYDEGPCEGCEPTPDPDPDPPECWQYFAFSTDGARLTGTWRVTGLGEGWLEGGLTDAEGYQTLAGTFTDGVSEGALWGNLFPHANGDLDLEGFGVIGGTHVTFYGLSGDDPNAGEGWFAAQEYALDARFVDGEVQGSWAGAGEGGALRGVYDDDGVVYAELEGSSQALWVDGTWWASEALWLWEGVVSGVDAAPWGWLYGEAPAEQAAQSLPTFVYPFQCE